MSFTCADPQSSANHQHSIIPHRSVAVQADGRHSEGDGHEQVCILPARQRTCSRRAGDPWLIATFPDLFDTTGEAASFLTKAWTCDRRSDGQFYITNHIDDVLNSAWFAQRNH
jgi:hypothetical protein